MRARPGVPAEPIVIDVDCYADRVKVLEMLSESYRLPKRMPDPMDGDLIQTRWQAESGRDQLSWWSRINYCLVIWRLQALQSAGKFPHVRLTGNLGPQLPSEVNSQLLRYYRAVSVFRKRSSPPSGMLQKLFWLVHARTVEAALKSAVELEHMLPEGERDFALGWGAIMVRVLAETNFSTGGATIGPLNLDLPQRILSLSDLNLADDSDLPLSQRETASLITTLYGRLSLSSIFLPVLAFGAPLVELFILAEQRFKEAFAALTRRSKR
jgi:hypothetical protein